MALLNYDVLKKSGYDGYILEDAPVKVLQFGEGNFLRAFVDYWFDLANEKAGWNGKCCLVQPIAPGLAKMINEQEGLYTLYLRGSENGQKVDDKRVISSVANCLNPYEKADYDKMMEVAASDDLEIIVSNTTEAGIQYDPSCQKDDCPPASFPAKLTQVLYHRYQAGKSGIIMLACELIDNNGKELLKCVNQYIEQWGLEDGFKKYVNEDCTQALTGKIAADMYQLSEMKAPDGYAVSTDIWMVEVTKNGALKTITSDGKVIEGNREEGTTTIFFQFENDPVYALPEAGGPGIFWYTAGGTLLMILAGMLALYKNKKSEAVPRN